MTVDDLRNFLEQRGVGDDWELLTERSDSRDDLYEVPVSLLRVQRS